MFKTLFAATAMLAVATPAFANDTAARTFSRDGETYTYTTVNKGNYVLISGRAVSGGTFQLRVRGDHVSGVSRGVPVSFTVPNAQAKLTKTEVAFR
ncbi:MAG: hypothetical protein WCS75_03235 [Sphingomonas sp.]|jgi:hypothetical protein|uniref:hypothetical protein n=1 Tax=Sphingomonas sp. TaxID=28214 RepID=UPI003568B364